ncbi:heat shock protein 40, type II [Plasmodium sp. gorilla clade G2]|uniref:heat shock protein 40, type II n=1 Tax=Plasmodium sp. gorilla clade G2 TaxID=880535 RepID=UPI000D22744A|nr:heat shock protein 40, type II [Plasmodium sp. gorilla clade G2]SOV10283.1 heat shock protein 40, type II [Plasmodium sp. gorilla clade G2]
MATLRKTNLQEIFYFSKFFMNACFISLLVITVNCFKYAQYVYNKDIGVYNEEIGIIYKRWLAESNKNFFFNKDNLGFGNSSVDYYSVLGVSKGCSEDDLRRAYLKLAMKWHPDKHVHKGTKEEAEEKFKNICEAYSVLSDNEQREKYDLFGIDALKQSGFNSSNVEGNISINPLEVFTKAYSFYNKYFSKSGSFGNNNIFTHIKNLYPMRNEVSEDCSCNNVEEYEVPLYVSLEDLYNGCTKKLKVTRKRYDGSYLYYEDYYLNVDIRQGWNNGTKLTFHGEGDQSSPDSYPGDLVLVLHTKNHNRFVRKSRDLYYRHIITLEQSLTGFDFVIKSLDNREIYIQIDEVVKPDTKKVITNEGMPYSRDPNIRGNLIVEFDIIYPNTIKKEQKKLIKEIFKENN